MKTQELSGKRVLNGTVQGLATAVIEFAVSLALARAMKFEAYGEYSAALGVLWITSILASIGMGQVATKIYRDTSDKENHLKARGLRMAGPALIVIVSTITYATLVGSHALIHDETAVKLASFAAVLSLLPMVCLRSFFRASGAAHGSAVTANALNGWIARLLFLLVLGAAIYIWGHPMPLLGVAAARATSSILVLFSLWLLLIRVEPGYLHTGKRRYEIGSWVKVGITFSMASLGLTIIDNAGVVVLGWVNSNAGATARLAAASAMGTVILRTAMNVRNIFTPALVEVISKRDPVAVRRIFRIWFLRVSMLLVPIAATLIAFAPWFLALFGKQFEDAYWTFIVYVCNYLVGSLNLLFIILYQYMGHAKRAMLIMMSAAVLGVIGMIVLGRIWLDLGVAIAVTISLNGAVLLMAWLGWRELRGWEPLDESKAPPTSVSV